MQSYEEWDANKSCCVCGGSGEAAGSTEKIEGEEAAEELERKRQELYEAELREEALRQQLEHAQVKSPAWRNM